MVETIPLAMQFSARATACFKYFSSIVLELHSHSIESRRGDCFLCTEGEMQPFKSIVCNYFLKLLLLGLVFLGSPFSMTTDLYVKFLFFTHTFLLGFVLALLGAVLIIDVSIWDRVMY